MNDFIQELLNDNSIQKRIDTNGNVHRIHIIGRGENLFFQENEKIPFLFDRSNASKQHNVDLTEIVNAHIELANDINWHGMGSAKNLLERLTPNKQNVSS